MPWESMSLPKKAVLVVETYLEDEFGQKFDKNKELKIGKNYYHKFDFVSKDVKIIAEVKSCRNDIKNMKPSAIETRFQRDYIFDCLLLSKVEAQEKIFFLVGDEDLFNKFKIFKEVFISEEEVKTIFFDKNLL